MNATTKIITTKIIAAKRRGRIAATIGSALALNAALAAKPASAVIQPNPVTTTTTSTSTPTTVVNNKGIYNTEIGSEYVGKNAQALALDSQWCKSWGEGQYRIRDFKLNNVLAPGDRNTPVPEGSLVSRPIRLSRLEPFTAAAMPKGSSSTPCRPQDCASTSPSPSTGRAIPSDNESRGTSWRTGPTIPRFLKARFRHG
jgi:hypothetical protein